MRALPLFFGAMMMLGGCRSVVFSNVEYILHNKTKQEVIISWENLNEYTFGDFTIQTDTIAPGEAKIFAFLGTELSKNVACRGQVADSTAIGGISVLQIEFKDAALLTHFYTPDPNTCGAWLKSGRYDHYQTFILRVYENDFEP